MTEKSTLEKWIHENHCTIRTLWNASWKRGRKLESNHGFPIPTQRPKASIFLSDVARQQHLAISSIHMNKLRPQSWKKNPIITRMAPFMGRREAELILEAIHLSPPIKHREEHQKVREEEKADCQIKLKLVKASCDYCHFWERRRFPAILFLRQGREDSIRIRESPLLVIYMSMQMEHYSETWSWKGCCCMRHYDADATRTLMSHEICPTWHVIKLYQRHSSHIYINDGALQVYTITRMSTSKINLCIRTMSARLN